MKQKLLTIAVSAALLQLPSLAAADDGNPTFKLRGFGTLAVVHTNQDQTDYRNGLKQPTGAGYSHDWDPGVDSRLGLQGDLALTDKLAAVVQLVSERQYDKTFAPSVEWANVKYNITPDLSIRGGRMALPVFMLSDSRKVGYTYPWVRTPVETYFQVAFTSLNGGDLMYRANFGDASASIQTYYGSAKDKIPSSLGINETKAKNTAGVNGTFEYGALSFRAGYVRTKLDYVGDTLNQLFNGYRSLNTNATALAAGATRIAAGAAAAAAAPTTPAGLVPALQATASSAQAAAASAGAMASSAQGVIDDLEAKDKDATFSGIGATYDPGNWFVQGEFTQRKTKSFVADTTGWYLSGGMRIGKFTPFATYSRLKTDSEIHVSGASAATSITQLPVSVPPLSGSIDGYNASAAQINAGANGANAGVNNLLYAASYAQKDIGLGLRYDFMKNVDLKMQWDRVSFDNNGAGNTFTEQQPGFDAGKKVNVFSLAVDFVF